MKNKLQKNVGLAGVVLSILFIASCVKDNFEFDKMTKTDWNPNFAAPLVNSSLTIRDILKEADEGGNIQVDNTQFCSLIYRGELFSRRASDLINIPDQNYSTNYALTAVQIATLGAGTSVTAQNMQVIDFQTGSSPATDPRIDSILFKASTLAFNISSTFRHQGELVISIPSAKKNGLIFSQSIPLNYSGSVPVSANPSYDLSGYTFDMTNGGTSYNKIVINYQLTLISSGNPTSPGDQVSINLSFNNNEFSKIFGYIGQNLLSPDVDSIEVTLFNDALGGGVFEIVEPSIKVDIFNSYGVPIRASFTRFDSYNVNSNPQYVTITGTPNPLEINYPLINEVGQTKITSFTLDKNTSNNTIVGALNNNKPRWVIYQINSQSNAGGPTNTNFVIDTSRFKVDMEIKLPLYGKADNFVLQDTMDFGFENPEEIESLLLRTYASNGFPITIDMQLIVLDSANNRLETLVGPNQIIMQGAPVDGSGRVTAPAIKTTDIIIDKARFQNINNAKKIVVRAQAQTTDYSAGKNVKIYADYKLDVKVGAQIKLKTKI